MLTPQEARIILLEDALRQAQHTVEFMHNCLTHAPHYCYGHPDQTLDHLEEWAKLVPLVSAEPCCHSMIKEDCPSCQEHHRLRVLRFEACKVLGIEREYL